LRVTLTAAEVAGAGTLELRVQNPAPGGGASNAATLEMRAPVPVIASLAAAQALVGTPSFALRVNGTGFASNAEVRFNGAARPTRLVSATQLEATLNVGDLQAAGSFEITVANPAPGGGVSNAVAFVVANPGPVIASLSPGAVATGSPGATVTVAGTGFVPQSQVLTGAAPRQTAYVSATELKVTLTAAEVAAAGPLELRVQNPAPGGGLSNGAVLELRAPVPAITSLDPAHTLDGQGTLELVVNGTGFAANSEVRIGGSARPTRATGTTRLEATLNMGDLQAAGSFPITVTTPGPGGGTSNAVVFEVRAPAPTLTSLGVTQTLVGQSSLALKVNGTGFRASSEVRVNGAARPTTLLNATQLEATLGAGDLQTAGTLEITVVTPGPGGGTSAAAQLLVMNPAPKIDLLPSRGAHAGGPGFTLTVHGSGFVAGTVVRWNGSDRPTTLISDSRVSASITSGDVASPGAAQVTVHTPAPGGGTSAAATMQVRAVPAFVVTSTREVPVSTRDLVWSAATGRLYGSVPGAYPTYGNNVVAVDPTTGDITGSVFVGSEPWAMDISDDGQVLYVALHGFDGTNSVRRVELTPLAAGLEFPVDLDARDIAVMPGRPGTVAVAEFSDGSGAASRVCLYDDGVRRPLCATGTFGINDIEFGEDGSVLYGAVNEGFGREFTTIRVLPNGLQTVRASRLSFSFFMRYAAGRLYFSEGAVIDGGEHVRVGAFTGAGLVEPDPTLGRLFSVNHDNALTVYDMNTLSALGRVHLGSFGFNLLRWGSDGLAYSGGGGLNIIRTPLAAP
ncbi:MAG TPA: hypothetical protein VFR81_10120, partial [Longimicrobium sp.]|nr:hypothetical protein [Longimicrobium sp.]